MIRDFSLPTILPAKMTEAERRLYRQLFLRRYALLLQKVEQSFPHSKDFMESLRRHILSLDWVDTGIHSLAMRLTLLQTTDGVHE
jgi:hypothetical protein